MTNNDQPISFLIFFRFILDFEKKQYLEKVLKNI